MAPPYQLWSRPLLSSDNVVAVTADALVLMSVPLEELPDVEAGWLRQGKTPPDATVIPLSHIHEAYAADNEGKLTVFHGLDKVGYRKEVFFDGPTPRDQVLAELHGRLGSEWELDDRDRMMAGTLVLLLVVLIVTTVAGFFGVRQIEAGTAPDGVAWGTYEWLAGSIGSLGVLVGGAAACLLCLWGVIHTSRKPPKGRGVRLKRIGVASRY